MTVEICTGSMSKRKKEGEEEVNTYTLVLSSLYPCSAMFAQPKLLEVHREKKGHCM